MLELTLLACECLVNVKQTFAQRISGLSSTQSTLQHSPFDAHICTLMVEVAVRSADLLIRSNKTIQLELPNWRVPIGAIWGSVSFPRILPNHDLPISGRPALPILAPNLTFVSRRAAYLLNGILSKPLKKKHFSASEQCTDFWIILVTCVRTCTAMIKDEKRDYLGAISSCIKAYQLL